MTKQRRNQNKKRIPRFKSMAEESAFWDKHSLTEHLDEFRPVKGNFSAGRCPRMSRNAPMRCND